MADLLTAVPEGSRPGWWPVDRLILAYLAGISALIAIYFSHVPDAGWFLAAHAGGAVLIVAAVKMRPRRGSWAHRMQIVFRHWYPLPYVAACYKVVAVVIPPVRGVEFDAAMARLDRSLWGVDPTVWLERVQRPWLTELLQLAYSLFVPAVLLVAWLLWRRRRLAAFQYYAFLIALGFLASYIGYLLVPVRGPRFLLAGLQHAPLRGLWLFPWLQQVLDRLESAHYDCFPSGHTELTLLAWWGSRQVSRKLFGSMGVYSALILFATVYLRYHYTIDVFAGAALAFGLVIAAPYFCRTERPSVG